MANKSRKFLALVLTLVLAFSLMSVAVAAAGETNVSYINKLDSSSEPVVIGSADNATNFFVAVKQAGGGNSGGGVFCWTANGMGDSSIQNTVNNAPDVGNGQNKFTWSYFSFDQSNLGTSLETSKGFSINPNSTATSTNGIAHY